MAEGYQLIIEMLGGEKEYKSLRMKLIKMAENRGATSSQSEEVVDESFDRAARKLNEDTVIRKNIGAFVYGFFNNVLLEYFKKIEKESRFIDVRADYDKALEKADELVADERLDSEDFDTIRLDCLDSCLHEIYPKKEDRELILSYYGVEIGKTLKKDSDDKAKKEAEEKKSKRRQALAEKLDLKYGTLRQRASRALIKLEKCITECIEKKASSVT